MNNAGKARFSNTAESICLRFRSPLPCRLAAVALVLLALLAPNGNAQFPASAPTDLQVKAAYLYKFGAFVKWPNPAPRDAFSICILGRDPFGPTLDSTLLGGSIDGAQVGAVRISAPQEAAQCRIVFVSSSEEPHLKSILSTLEQVPVLTVSDIPHFTDRGGMIQFVLENGRIRFEVNLSRAERAGIGLSSQLLKVATEVKRDGGSN